MPRESVESLTTAVVSIPTRPNAPEGFTPKQAELWRNVVNTKPPEWFESDSFPLLKAYCLSACQYDDLIAELPSHEISSVEFNRILGMVKEQALLIATLATKMRLTQQSRYTPRAASSASKKTKSGAKPWG